jgi:hypothetical protein
MSPKLFIHTQIALSLFCLQLQTEVCAQSQSEKKIFYELRDALKNKLDNNQTFAAPGQNQVAPMPVQQPYAQPVLQPGANGMAGGIKDRAKQEIEIMVDKKLGTNLSNQVNAPLNSNVAPVSNPAGIIPGVQNILNNGGYTQNQQTMPVPTNQPAQVGGFNLSNLGVELKDLKVPEKYKQDYYRYRNKVKDMTK